MDNPKPKLTIREIAIIDDMFNHYLYSHPTITNLLYEIRTKIYEQFDKFAKEK